MSGDAPGLKESTVCGGLTFTAYKQRECSTMAVRVPSKHLMGVRSASFALMKSRQRYDRDRLRYRRKLLEGLLGGKCIDCDVTSRLEFHHLDPTEKLFDISSTLTAPWAILVLEAEKCVLVCKPHHIERSPQSLHGTRSGYTNLKCREECCRAANREYFRQRRSMASSSSGEDASFSHS